MSTYTATIRWNRTGDGDFAKGQYSRAHEWAFDGGAVVPAAPSPHVVPAPWSDPAGVDPEEAFIASLSSCHMLFFVDFARRAGFVLDSYVDEAEGVLEKRADGKMAMTRVTLRPRVTWAGDAARRGRDRRPPPPRPRSLLHRQLGNDGRDGRALIPTASEALRSFVTRRREDAKDLRLFFSSRSSRLRVIKLQPLSRRGEWT